VGDKNDTERPPERPPGWRDTWHDPKPKSPGRARAKESAQAILHEPLPSRAALSDEALRILRAIATDVTAASSARVQAAKAIAEACKSPAPEEAGRALAGIRKAE
jgi:hypothetical protein